MNKSYYKAVLDLVTSLVNVKTINAFSEMIVNSKELLGFDNVLFSEITYHKTCNYKIIFTDDELLLNVREKVISPEFFAKDDILKRIKDGEEVLKINNPSDFIDELLGEKSTDDIRNYFKNATCHALSKMNKETLTANLITFLNMTQNGSDKFGAMAGYLHTHLIYAYGRIMSVGDQNRSNLSERELSVITWLKYGKTSWEVAKILDITENTVNFHIKNIKRKLNATNRQHAVAIAIAQGILG
ncbi:MAG: hypothetical protein C0603_01565 [Denitrovibrio sp.]|nr:MAG: hypothetical protein C0603_01565 [Denitrovibrio sp.]